METYFTLGNLYERFVDYNNSIKYYTECNIFAKEQNNIIYEVQNDVLNQLFRYDNVPVKIGSTDNYLVVTTRSNVFIYDSGFNLVYQPTVSPTLETEFNTATINNDNIYFLIMIETFGLHEQVMIFFSIEVVI